jgi:putative hemolysin
MRPIRNQRLLSITPNALMLMSGSAFLLLQTDSLMSQLTPDVDSTYVWLSVLGMVGALAISALLVGAETALDLLRPMHVRFAKEKSPKKAERLDWQIDHRASLIAAVVLGRQTAKLAIVFFSLILANKLAASQTASEDLLGIAAMYALLMVVPLGLLSMIIDLVPKSYATLHPHRVALRLDRFMRASWALFGVPAALITFVANILTSRFGGQATFEIQNPMEEEIKTIVESAEETGEIETDERELLHSVFEFTDTVAREIMTPRVDMDAVSIKTDPMEIVKIIRESGHSRIPIFEETDDQIIGIVHAKDILLAAMDDSKPLRLRPLLRPALFVPESKGLHDLLREMRVARTQLAVVQDEFGGTAGVVTVEDIVEELIGEIVDEYDVEEPEIVKEGDAYVVGGKAHVDDVNEVLGSDFQSDEFDTIGGFVFGLFGRQPLQNECFDTEPWRFCVAETNGRRILKLRIEKLREAEQAEALDFSD